MFIADAYGMDRGIPLPVEEGEGRCDPGDFTKKNSEISIQRKELRREKKKE